MTIRIKKIGTLPSAKAGATSSQSPSQADILAQQRLGQDAVSATAQQWPEQYDGCQYTHIIEAWLQSQGIYGGVAQGNRNNMYYRLALEMRYICDFNKDWLLALLPAWELPLSERQSVVNSALNKPRGRQLPDLLLRAIERVKALGDVSQLDEQAVSNEMRNPLPTRLPYIFKLISRRFPQNPHAMILCSLPPLGALCTNVRSEYIDGELEEALFYCILTSPQASGKRILRRLDDMLTFALAEHDKRERDSILEFKAEQRRRKNDKKQPEQPEVHIRKVPAKVSQRVFLERTYYAEQKSLYSFGEELDSLSKAMKGGAWADLSDLLRLGFDGGEFGSDYAAENSFAAVCKARWCMLMAGTWGAVERFFPNLEDGTMTRFMFAQLEDSSGKPLLPRVQNGRTPAEKSIREEAERLYNAYSYGEVQRIALPQTIQALLKWQDIQLKIYELGGKVDAALDTLRRRAMLIGFRSALVAAATERLQDSSVVANFAVWVAQEVLDQQMALFAKGLNEVNRHEQSLKQEAQGRLRQNSTLRYLALLPDAFTLQDLVGVYKQMGNTSPCHMLLHRWLNQGLIVSEMRDGIVCYTKANAQKSVSRESVKA